MRARAYLHVVMHRNSPCGDDAHQVLPLAQTELSRAMEKSKWPAWNVTDTRFILLFFERPALIMSPRCCLKTTTETILPGSAKFRRFYQLSDMSKCTLKTMDCIVVKAQVIRPAWADHSLQGIVFVISGATWFVFSVCVCVTAETPALWNCLSRMSHCVLSSSPLFGRCLSACSE